MNGLEKEAWVFRAKISINVPVTTKPTSTPRKVAKTLSAGILKNLWRSRRRGSGIAIVNTKLASIQRRPASMSSLFFPVQTNALFDRMNVSCRDNVGWEGYETLQVLGEVKRNVGRNLLFEDK